MSREDTGAGKDLSLNTLFYFEPDYITYSKINNIKTW